MASFRVGRVIFQTFVIAYKIKTLLGAEIIENIDSSKVSLQNIFHPLLFLTRQGLLITSILYYWFKREDRRDMKCLLVNYTTPAEDNGKKRSSDTGHLGLTAPTARFNPTASQHEIERTWGIFLDTSSMSLPIESTTKCLARCTNTSNIFKPGSFTAASTEKAGTHPPLT